MTVSPQAAQLYERVKSVILPAEWSEFAPDIDAIIRLKRERNAVILAHNYQTPEIFHGVADIVGDSLALAREAMKVDADVIVLAGVHFMAETAKLLNPAKRVLIPDLRAGCSLAASITAEDVRLLRQRWPGVPVVTYVNTSAAVKAESDICCTSGNARKIVESLGVPKVIMLPDEYLAQNIARETDVEIITWAGHCEVHERFSAADVRQLRAGHPGVVVLAHPECPPEVVAEADFAGSTAAMADYVTRERPGRVVLMTECSMSDNIAASNPDIDFVRPCNLCPHMKRITLPKIRRALETLQYEVTIDPAVAAPARRAVERMLLVRWEAAMETMRSELAGCPVIIGGGLAGVMTALRLAPRPVILLAKVPLAEGAASAWAQGGIAAAVGEDDRAALHAADTLAASDGLGDSAVASRVAAAAPAAIIELERHGVVFDRDAAGRLALGLEAAHGRRRIVHVAGDGTGAAIMRALVAAVQATPSITVIEGLEARRLLVDDRGIAGVLAAGPFDACLLPTRRVVLATGGLGGLFAHTTNPLGAIGQGLALAARAGAALADMEFVQFHPTALDVGLDPMPLVSEAVRGEGAVLIDETGARFMSGKGRGELEPRDVVSRAVAAHIVAGHRVFLDARASLGTDFATRFPGITARCRAANIDPTRQPIPVRPAMHYHMGGIAVDAEGCSTVEGLWACGEVAATGLHGANRLASNSLLEAVVMAVAVAGSIAGTQPARLPAPRPVALPIAPSVETLRDLISETLGVVRDRAGLERAAAHLQPLAFKGGGAADPALVALMIATAALAREESRGGHWRSDFPQPSPAWARRILQRVHDADTKIVCRAVPLATVSQPLVAGA